MFTKKMFGERFRRLRKAKGEAQTAIAQVLGVTVTQISDMENGKTMTTLEKLTIICQHYHVSADYLLGLTDDPAALPSCGVRSIFLSRQRALIRRFR